MGLQGFSAGCGRAVGRGLTVVAVAAALGACATRSADVRPLPTDPATYADWSCERIADEVDLVQQRAADVAYAVDARSGNNLIALGVGITVFWPALLAMRPDGPEATHLAELKGRYEALRQAAARQACAPASPEMPPGRAAALPVAAGERLVYDDRPGGNGARLLGLRLLAPKRDRLEFIVDIDGREQPGPWVQDLAGNALPDAGAPLLRWRHLLRASLELGQVLSGELGTADGRSMAARVRGQVVATGPQELGGRQFDVAVIELFGEAPQSSSDAAASTRLDGVMAVDRRSGLLLRLELNCANPDYALRRRLLRVEPVARS